MQVWVFLVLGRLSDTNDLAVGTLKEVVLKVQALLANDKQSFARLKTDDARYVVQLLHHVAALEAGHDFAIFVLYNTILTLLGIVHHLEAAFQQLRIDIESPLDRPSPG